MSHDIRTPMSAIIGLTAIAKRTPAILNASTNA
ncbi:MAG: histidine kinase dimerization/phospho-acceptor domain-containing protein [Bilophila wadsworthia]